MYLHIYQSIPATIEKQTIGIILALIYGMKTKKADLKVLSISSIIETKAPEGGGLIGYTVHYRNGRFTNIMREYTEASHDTVLADLCSERLANIGTADPK